MSEPKIKLIKEDSDLSNINLFGWDLEVNGIPYNVYSIRDYYHTIGGKHGNNCLWACPADEKPSYKNLVQFNGDAPTWGVTFDRVNSVKNKWETSIEANGICYITRNGRKFYNIPARYMDYGLASAQHILVQLLESCPLSLNMRNWKEEAVERKIYYREQPAIIESVNISNELFVVPDGMDSFKKPVHWREDGDEEMWEEDYGDGLIVDLLSKDIWWFRD